MKNNRVIRVIKSTPIKVELPNELKTKKQTYVETCKQEDFNLVVNDDLTTKELTDEAIKLLGVNENDIFKVLVIPNRIVNVVMKEE